MPQPPSRDRVARPRVAPRGTAVPSARRRPPVTTEPLEPPRPVPAWFLLPLRAFLAIVFVYAGLQKLANPAFFDWNSPVSLHAQMLGFVRTSPIHGLISPLVPYATIVGIVIALGELAVGVGMALGLFTRLAAIGGMCISLSLFLTVSFHYHPWYTGADIVYLFTFTPFAIAGAGGLLSVDAWLAAHPVRQRGGLDRRRVLIGGMTAALAALLAGADAAFGRVLGSTTTTKPPVQLGPTGSTGSTGSSGHHGTAIGPASDVPVGQAGNFTVPSSGDPGLVIHTAADTFVAYDAVCPHAGCQVGYDAPQDVIACPCHGSTFNVQTGAAESGPAVGIGGLTPLTVTDQGGQLYVS